MTEKAMERPLYAYVYAHVPYDDAIALLAADAATLLQDATHVGVERAREVVTTLHVPIGGFEVGRDVVVTAGEFRPVEVLRGVLPVQWHAAHGAGLFPSLAASLELSALSLRPPVTQVTLQGAYTPPLRQVGAMGDAAVGHRVAEATVQRFVEDVARRLERALAPASRAS